MGEVRFESSLKHTILEVNIPESLCDIEHALMDYCYQAPDTTLALHRYLFSLMSEEAFQAMADELRRAMRIKPFNWPLF